MVQVPYSRLTTLKDVTPDAESTHYVIYWCIAFKRTTYNYALQRAVEWANKLSKPLLIFEPIAIDYPMASIRFHKFAIEGMRDIQKQIKDSNRT